MAQKTRKERAEARERRRSLMSEPFEALDEAAGRDEAPGPGAVAKHAAATAAATALAGALAGAAKAYADRRSAEQRTEEPEQHDEEPRDEPQREQPTAEEPEPDEADEPDDEQPEQPVAEQQMEQPEEDQQEPAAAEADDDRDGDEPRAEGDGEQPSAEHDGNGRRGASASDAGRIVRQAREQLQELLGVEAESVSGLERSNGNWSVTVEVVEMHRVPESTDILSSYSVVLDDDGGIVSLTRGRRYRRSQVEEGR